MDRSELKILIIEDDREDYMLTREVLMEGRNWSLQLDWAKTYEEGMEQVARAHHDVYLVDYNLGAHTGLDIVHAAREIPLHQPFILLTGRGDYDTDLQAALTGASDYLEKGRITPNLLERSIRYALRQSSSETALRARVDELLKTKQKLERISSKTAKEFDRVLVEMKHEVAGLLNGGDPSPARIKTVLLKQQKQLDALDALVREISS